LCGCGNQRFLNGVFARSEIAETAHDGAEHLRREVAKDSRV
jgi:hypothetical protein